MRNLLYISVITLLYITVLINRAHAQPQDSTKRDLGKSKVSQPAVIIIKLEKNKFLFFYKQSKFLYTSKEQHYVFENTTGFKADTVFSIDNPLPNVLVFQERLDKRIPIIIFPGDTLIINMIDNDRLQFTGTKSIEWNMMADIADEYSIVESHMYNRTYKNIIDLETDLQVSKSKLLSTIKTYSSRYNLSKSYIDYLLREINYHFVKSWAHHNNSSLKDGIIPLYIKENIQLALNDSLNAGSRSRHSALYSTVQVACNCVENVFPSKYEFVVLFDFIKKNYKGINQTQLLLSILYEQIEITSTYKLDKSFFQPYIDYFYEQNKDSDYQRFLESLTKTSIVTPALSLDSIGLMTTSGQNQSLKSINRIKKNDKIILIDFWASWCAPCVAEIPTSKRLQASYRDRGIRFVYLSIDKDRQKWAQANQRFMLSDSQSFLISEAGKRYLTKRIALNSIPRYILIRADGVIVDENMPKPSDPNFLKIVENQLTP